MKNRIRLDDKSSEMVVKVVLTEKLPLGFV